MPFTARCEASNAAEQLAKTFSRYDSIGKYVSSVPATPSIIARMIKLACDNNTDIVDCWIEDYPKSQTYIVHITWDKLLPFRKNTCVVVKWASSFGTSIEHTRMNKDLKEDIKKWKTVEFSSGLSREESIKFWGLDKKSD